MLQAAWADAQWNEHTKEDYYAAMQSFHTVRANAKHPSSVKPKHFLLKFTTGKKTPGPNMTADEWTRRAVAARLGAMRVHPRRVKGLPQTPQTPPDRGE